MRHFIVTINLLVIGAFGCDGAHPATATSKQFADGLAYGDRDAVFNAHIESTSQTEYCRPQFRNLLSHAAETSTPQRCDELLALDAAALDQMPDELRLAAQVGAWTCGNPRGACEDYARTVFLQAIARHPHIAEKPKAAAVREVSGDEQRATAYLDVTKPSGEIDRMAIKLKLVGEGWRIESGVFAR